MAKKRFLNAARQKWLARSFQGLFLIAAAGAAGEAFLKFPLVGRVGLTCVVLLSFALGLYFAKADRETERKEE